jgi:biopolymer transport protein ExbB
MSDVIVQVGLLFYPLLCLSLLGSIIIVERFIFFICLPKLENSKSFKALKQELQNNISLPKTVRDELLSLRLVALKSRLEKGLGVLRIVAVLSPMLGLLGTVLGMIEAFQDISQQTGAVLPSMIADGLWSAMLTTAYGLAIALPCLFAEFIYIRLAERRLASCQNRLNTQSLKLEGVKFHD